MPENQEPVAKQQEVVAEPIKVDEFGQLIKANAVAQTHEEVAAALSDVEIAPEDQGEEFGNPLTGISSLMESVSRAIPFEASQIQKKN